MKGALQTLRVVIEIGLIDGRAGEAVLNENVDVVLAQAQHGLVAGGIGHHQPTALVYAGRYERGFGSGDEFTGPAEDMSSLGSGRRLGAAGGQLLAGLNRLTPVVDLHLALHDHHARAVGIGTHRELCAQGSNFPPSRLYDKRGTVRARLSWRDFDKHFTRGQHQPAIGFHAASRILVDVQNRSIRQSDPATLAGFRADGTANSNSLSGDCGRSRPRSQVFRDCQRKRRLGN